MRHVTSDNFLIGVVGICVVFAIGLLALPAPLHLLLGLETGPNGLFVSRELGAALFGLSAIFWGARDTWDLPRQIFLGGLVHNSLGFAIALGSIWSGLLSGGGWILVLVHLVLAAGFAWFRQAK